MFDSVRLVQEPLAPVLVMGVFKGNVSEANDAGTSLTLSLPAVAAALRRREWTGEPGNIVEAWPSAAENGVERVLLVGLGRRDKLNAEKMRDLAAKVGRRLAQIKEPNVGLDIASALRTANVDDAQTTLYGRCWGESLGLLAWKAKTMPGTVAKNKADTDPTNSSNAPNVNGDANNSDAPNSSDDLDASETVGLNVTASDAAFAQGLQYGLTLAQAVNTARTLSQTPPNIATPLYIAQQAQQLAEQTGLTCRILQGEELEQERLTGLINVGKASIHPPCLIRLEYVPDTGKRKKEKGESGELQSKIENQKSKIENPSTLVLIGKTITYDTGGLTLKINNGMVGMKRDKDGGCAVLGAMQAVATLLKPAFPVVGLLVAAENMVSDAAFRPDDVLTYRNGVTVEVTNTDAEGRLVLADALCWACSQENPGAIVDLATLTGGVVTALGSTYAGLFCEDEGLRARLEQASEASGERIWRLPLHPEYRDMLKSPVADIINSNPNRKAHPIQGAAFLSYFVTENTPWAHIDIAGVHAVDGDSGPCVKGPTGYGVRLLADLVTAYKPA